MKRTVNQAKTWGGLSVGDAVLVIRSTNDVTGKSVYRVKEDARKPEYRDENPVCHIDHVITEVVGTGRVVSVMDYTDAACRGEMQKITVKYDAE